MFVSSFIVAGKSRHELLTIAGFDLFHESICSATAQDGDDATLMGEDDVAVLASCETEP